MKRYLYTEKDMKFIVKELDDRSNENYTVKDLEIVKILKQSKIFTACHVGEEFTVTANFGYDPGWDLEEILDD